MTSNPEIKIRHAIPVQFKAAKSLPDLLFDFIELLICLMGVKPFFIACDLQNVTIEQSEGKWSMQADLLGDEFDPNLYGKGVEVKAPSYHDISISFCDKTKNYCLKFIVDI